MVDESRLVATQSSNHDCIGAYINNKNKRAIYEQSELPWRLIRLMKDRSVKTIAIFDSNANDPSI